MAKQPLCSNTDDGKCPCFALAGTRYCLQHAEMAQVGFGEPIDTGYRPGGFAADDEVVIVSFAGHIRPLTPTPVELTELAGQLDAHGGRDEHDIATALREVAPLASTSWNAPPPPARRRGWLARALQWATS